MSARGRSFRARAADLVIADAGVGHVLLNRRIARPRHALITCRHPLEVIRCLQDESHVVDTIFYPVGDLTFETGGLSVFLADEFPCVRRIGYGKDGVIHRVWSRSRAHAADAELDRSARRRVGELVAAMGFSEEDAEDIVQDTLLQVFLGSGKVRALDLDGWLVALTAQTASDRERGNQRRARLRVAAVSEAATCRTSRESDKRPDAALLTVELADLASAAVDSLPGWCRGAFQLRVLQEHSALSASAALGLLPATVDVLLAHARQRIGVSMRQHLV